MRRKLTPLGEGGRTQHLSGPREFINAVPDTLRDQLEGQLRRIRALRQYRPPLSPNQRKNVNLWQRQTVALLLKAFGDDSDQAAEFEEIAFEPGTLFGRPVADPSDRYREGLDTAEVLLKTVLDIELGSAATAARAQSPTAFISASFDDQAAVMVDWFCQLARAVGFSVIWLKEFAEPRPPAEKVKEYLMKADCLIQIITGDVVAKEKDRGWIGNEMAWSETHHGRGRQALFVERGVKATGIAREITESVDFDPHRLHEIAPRAVAYLRKLQANVQS